MSNEMAKLRERRAELVQRLEAIQRDIGSGLDRDYEEQAVQLENLEVLQEIARVARVEISEIDRKLSTLASR